MAEKFETLLERVGSADIAGLMSIWQARDPEEWSGSSEIYRALGERILKHGEPLLAYDAVNEGLTKWPADIRLSQLQGLALARSGATERANIVLENLRREGQNDEETLGMLGSARVSRADFGVSPKQSLDIDGDQRADELDEGEVVGLEAAACNWQRILSAI